MNNKSYPEPTAGALILNEKEEVLLCKSPKFNNKFIIPGGHVEIGETLEQTLKREVKEETGLEIEPVKFINFYNAINPKDFFEKRHFIFFDFLCKVKDKSKLLLDNKELTEFLWIEPEKALKELDLEVYTKKIIVDYLKGDNNNV